jgi:hypothetical protein
MNPLIVHWGMHGDRADAITGNVPVGEPTVRFVVASQHVCAGVMEPEHDVFTQCIQQLLLPARLYREPWLELCMVANGFDSLTGTVSIAAMESLVILKPRDYRLRIIASEETGLIFGSYDDSVSVDPSIRADQDRPGQNGYTDKPRNEPPHPFPRMKPRFGDLRLSNVVAEKF